MPYSVGDRVWVHSPGKDNKPGTVIDVSSSRVGAYRVQMDDSTAAWAVLDKHLSSIPQIHQQREESGSASATRLGGPERGPAREEDGASMVGVPKMGKRVPGLTPFGETVVGGLRNAADIFEERAAVYRDNYARVGAVMAGLFPDGAPVLKTPEDYNRWHLLELAIVKLTRYAVNYDAGHQDSLDDAVVYLSMVRALDIREGRT